MAHLVVGTAGHIDHGKSSLVRALTGTDPDRLKEEKARGITIDLGFAHWQQGELTVAFVDVPGHERFVKNMLAGAGGIDAVLLVIAADEGVMPQTREHLDICRLLGIDDGIVALTKADLVDDDTLELARIEVAELLAGTRLASAPVVGVSSVSGLGLDTLASHLVALAAAVRPRDDGGAVRLPIDRVFSVRGFGTVVTGTLVSGRLAVDQELELTPGDRRAKVRGVQVHGSTRSIALAGQRAAVNLAGLDVTDVARGQVLVTPGTLPARRVLDTAVSVLPSAPPLVHGARVRFHEGTAETLARVAIVGRAAADHEPPAIQPGETGFVRLRLELPAAVTRRDRFVLRRYSPAATIAGGRVLDPSPPRMGVRAAATAARLQQLHAPLASGQDEEAALLVLVAEAGAGGVALDSLVARAGAATSRGRGALERLRASDAVWQVGDRLVLRSWASALADRVRAAVSAHHEAQPLSDGLPREEIRERVLGDAHPAVAAAVLDDLSSAGVVHGRDRIALAGRAVALSSEDDAAVARLLERYRAAGLTPADAASMAEAAGISAARLAQLSQLLVRRQVLVKVESFVFHHEALERLKADVRALKAGGDATVDVARFKEMFGLTRKFAIPLLEYLDRERVTRRTGDKRVVL
jgi:selenocysteine-specific elongation factor